MIKIKDLYKIYKTGEAETRALDGVSLEVKEGEYVFITGRSGAGKSTLLYNMGLLDRPTSGEIYINEQATTNMSERKRTGFRLFELGYIFQDYALLPELSAYENVIVPLLMQGLEMRVVEKMAKDALMRVGLKGKEINLPSQLSGGQQQRVSIARAIAGGPKILFADEPTANLDSQTAKTVMDLLKELNGGGQTIVLVTHEKNYHSDADRIIEMSDGKILK